MTKEYIYLVTDEIQLTPICEDCGPNLVPVMRIEELIRCKDCKYYDVGQNETDAWSACYAHIGRIIETWDDNFCGWAERKDDETD